MEPKAYEKIRDICTKQGLTIEGASRRGVLLELTPVSLDDLPSAMELAAIADELAGDGVRYVALAIDGASPS